MSDTRGVLIVGPGATLLGEVHNARRVEVDGEVEGGVWAGDVIVHPSGRVTGKLVSDTADVRGKLQGDIRIQNLISIRSTGAVMGTVKYGRLAMEDGGDLAANMRNVPPSISGDLDLVVARGGSVKIMRSDLSAYDPDDKPQNLSFTVSNAVGGHVARAGARFAIQNFSQAELAEGRILFIHDGGAADTSRFDVVVADASGATSGPPKTVTVAVKA